ncbi:MAG TPA: branched-chain amino acid transaminase [Candidatus Aminicenantes bacterium]|nr:branched-chain amino acid transaminase [Candidatus Aminicenantes bacterium]HRY64259.1 branched-chain amino acid transaminase [Candidatus Aminicenantes bacterium]HRZ71172.1 branched-chain amino acid transaminase [Candidatus Aminicenantes bacterium]
MFLNTNFPKAKKYWYQGKFHDWSEAGFHPMMHALHYGTCVFEGIRAYPTAKGPAVFRLPEHNDRFFLSAGVIKMAVPYTKEQVSEAICETVRANGLNSCYIRPLYFYSYGNLGMVPKACPVELAISAWEWAAYLGENAASGVRAFILPTRRIHHTQFNMAAKLGGTYVQSTIAGLEAREQGFDEAIFLNMEGRIAEGPGQNVFIVKDGTLVTNGRTESALEGITRTSLLELGQHLGYKTVVGRITKEDLFGADEAFYSGTAVEVIPIVSVTDGSDPAGARVAHTIGSGKPGPVAQRMIKAFADAVSGRLPQFEKWLTYVGK